MSKIKSISEAFSMQPRTLSVDKIRSNFNPDESVKEIVLERSGEDSYSYVGYNFEGKMLFKYLEHSVNVHYEI